MFLKAVERLSIAVPRPLRANRAQALIELTLVLPLLLLLSLGVVEFSNMINAYLVLAHLTREAANIASREPGIKGQEPWSTNIVNNFNQLIAAASPVIRNTTDAERQQWKIIYSIIEYGGDNCGEPLASPATDPDKYRIRRSNAGWSSGITWEYGLLPVASRIGENGACAAIALPEVKQLTAINLRLHVVEAFYDYAPSRLTPLHNFIGMVTPQIFYRRTVFTDITAQ